MPRVVLDGVTKKYGQVTAVSDFSLEVRDGEFMVLLGPSGCGKSTVLRLIAGVEEVNSGHIRIGDRDVTALQPRERDIAMVFESPDHALYPHLTAYDNMAFGLRLRREFAAANGGPVDTANMKRGEARAAQEGAIRRRVEQVAGRLGLQPYLGRKKTELSAGQGQEVALGRALVRSTKVFLMDDPLSQLDTKARIAGRNEIRDIHKQTGSTIIYVTHDQFEAIALGDRIAVMDSGKLQQVGTAQNLYNHPVNMFVASFIGSPSMNLFPMFIDGDVEDMVLRGTDFTLHVPRQHSQRLYGRERIVLGLRPESIRDARFVPDADPDSIVHGNVNLVENTGTDLYVHISAGDQMFIARLDKRTHTRPGAPLDVILDTENMHAFDPVSERSLL